MFDVEMVDTWEQKRRVADRLISNIILQADLFEMRTRYKPTVFISYDLFALVAASPDKVVAHKTDNYQMAHTICGYDLEIIHQGKNLFYVGYKVDMSFLDEV